MIYIDNGKNVKMFSTSSKIEKAIITLLTQSDQLMSATTHDGYKVEIVESEAEDGNNN